jgi:hypothetical protein
MITLASLLTVVSVLLTVPPNWPRDLLAELDVGAGGDRRAEFVPMLGLDYYHRQSAYEW